MEIVTTDPLVMFIYKLLLEYDTAGVIEKLVDDCTCRDELQLTNGWLGKYAENVASRLREKI